jgi:hypothetical protein
MAKFNIHGGRGRSDIGTWFVEAGKGPGFNYLYLHRDGVIRETTLHKGEYLGWYRTRQDARDAVKLYHCKANKKKTETVVQAKKILRHAKKHGITLTRGAGGVQFPNLCARGVLAHMMTGTDNLYNDIPGISPHIARALELGFEGHTFERVAPKYQRYYNVGQKVREKSRT